jgi:DNA-binding transcriptional regulator YiaG
MIPESEENKVESPLKALREILGLTQEQFAYLLGVTVRTVSRWETGQGRPVFSPGQWKILLDAMKRVNLSLDNLPDELTPGNHLVFTQGD